MPCNMEHCHGQRYCINKAIAFGYSCVSIVLHNQITATPCRTSTLVLRCRVASTVRSWSTGVNCAANDCHA